MALDDFETENKHHHLTQRGELPLIWPLSEWFKVKWLKSGSQENAYNFLREQAKDVSFA